MKKSQPDYFEAFTSLVLICGILITAIGVYLKLNNAAAHGVSTGGRGAPPAGTPVNFSGNHVIVIGIAISFFPLYALIKKMIRRHFTRKNQS